MKHSEQRPSPTFELTYKAEAVKMVRIATLVLGSQSIAEEAVRDAFVQLHKRWFDVRNPGGFLQVAVMNRCRDLLKHRKVSDRYLESLLFEKVNDSYKLVGLFSAG